MKSSTDYSNAAKVVEAEANKTRDPKVREELRQHQRTLEALAKHMRGREEQELTRS